jgi:PAS domain S-box-containing protein
MDDGSTPVSGAVAHARDWLEQLLDTMPTPLLLIEPGTARVVFANEAASRMAGGDFPLAANIDEYEEAYVLTDANGRRLSTQEMPGVRAARGERLHNVELNWVTPGGVRSLIVSAGSIPASYGEPATIVLSFEDVTELKRANTTKEESLALLDALFKGAPIGHAYFDRELRFMRVNERLAEMNGLPASEHIGRTVPELLPGMDGDGAVEERLRSVLTTGEPLTDLEFVGRVPAAEEQKHFASSFYPVHDPTTGEISGIGVVALDVTDRRRAEAQREHALQLEREARAAAEEGARRARFLADAGIILDESLDFGATLTTVSKLAVPWLGDWCGVDIVDADGSLRHVTVAHVDPDKLAFAEEMQRRYPPDLESDRGLGRVLRTGEPEIYPDIPDELLAQGARDEEHLRLLRSTGMRSVMMVPMITRGRTLGVISFVAAETGRRYDENDLFLAGELARRAATSVDNARLYEERAYVARTLQESLLPPHLPDVPGVDLAARYRPVGEGIEVGGDFYDVFEIGPDSWAVVIGDVCGKGAAAAALTALVRYTLRAIATADKPPSEVLSELNDAILRQRSDNRFCTVAYARVTRTAAGLHADLSNGGHPLPLVIRAGGDVEAVGEPGTLLGVVDDPTLHDFAIDLSAGDTLVLYTDGVTEAGAPDNLLESSDLVEAILRCGGREATEVAECLERVAVDSSDGDPHDDIAVVVLHLPE